MPAPMRMTPSASDIVLSSSSPPMKIAGEMSRMNLVTHRPTSVEPATIVADGSATSSAAKSSSDAGTSSRLPPAPISTRLPSRIAASLR